MSKLQKLGAGRVMDYTQADFTRLGETYDLIFDAVGKLSFSRCRSSLAPGGRYLTVVPALDALLSRQARFAATGLRSPSQKAEDLRFVAGLVESGQFRAVIDRCYPLEQVAEARRHVETGHKRGNVVIMVAE